MLTVVRQVSGLQELGGEGAVGVLVRFLVARLSVLPVAASQRPLLGGAGRDLRAAAVQEQQQQVQQPPRGGQHLHAGPEKDESDSAGRERAGFKEGLPQRWRIWPFLRAGHRSSRTEPPRILIACLLVHSEETGGVLPRWQRD